MTNEYSSLDELMIKSLLKMTGVLGVGVSTAMTGVVDPDVVTSLTGIGYGFAGMLTYFNYRDLDDKLNSKEKISDLERKASTAGDHKVTSPEIISFDDKKVFHIATGNIATGNIMPETYYYPSLSKGRTRILSKN